jgi:homopolymeric O-antigen transport system permease protein
MEVPKQISDLSGRVSTRLFLIRSLVSRDIRAHYAESFLGIFWTVIHPVFLIGLYYFVFTVIMSVDIGEPYASGDFAKWLIAGMIPWIFFSDVVVRAPKAVLENELLIKKTLFPSEFGSVAHLCSVLIHHLVALAVVIAGLLLSGVGISWKIFWIIPYMAATSFLALGISWLVSALTVFFRDLGQLIGVLVQFWFFLTPIVYPDSLVPEAARTFYRLNPFFHVVQGYRVGLLGVAEIDLTGMAYLFGVSLFFLILGRVVFMKLKPTFPDFL